MLYFLLLIIILMLYFLLLIIILMLYFLYYEGALRGPGDPLWIAILIIIGVTAAIVLLSFFTVWCYRCTKRNRKGAMRISQKVTALLASE